MSFNNKKKKQLSALKKSGLCYQMKFYQNQEVRQEETVDFIHYLFHTGILPIVIKVFYLTRVSCIEKKILKANLCV